MELNERWGFGGQFGLGGPSDTPHADGGVWAWFGRFLQGCAAWISSWRRVSDEASVGRSALEIPPTLLVGMEVFGFWFGTFQHCFDGHGMSFADVGENPWCQSCLVE